MNLIRFKKTKVSLNNWLTRILLVCIVQGAATNIQAQNNNEPKISLELNNVKLLEVFTELEKASEYSFRYTDEISRDARIFSFSFSETPISTALKQIASKAGLSYKIDGKDVSVKKMEKKKVSGIISDAATGEPLIGVTVSIKGTSEGTITNIDGEYSIMAYPIAELSFSSIGYNDISVKIAHQAQINISLESEATGLEEVVVIGYGTQKKINLTGSVANISGGNINKRPITQGTQALQGMASGIFVNTNSGEPGNDDASITIRGIGTFNNAEPLVLIDGIEAPLAHLNANDIESINVLKDAASASIYGTRAANGVILVTTKRGKVGGTLVTYNGSYSVTSPTVKPKFVMKTRTYLETYVKACEYSERNNPFTPELIDELSALPETNWIDDYIKKGSIKNHDFSFAGGNEMIKYRFSSGYLDQKGYLEGDWYNKRFNSRLNVDAKLSEKFNMGVSMAYSNNNNRQATKNDPGQSLGNSGTTDRYGGKGNFLYQILLVNVPYSPVYDQYGRYAGTGSESSKSQRDNPQALIDNQWIDIDGNEFLGNAFLEFEPINGLKFKYVFGINSQQESYEETRLQYEQYDRFGNLSATRVPGSLLRTRESSILNYTNWLQANFTKSINNHIFNILAGVNQETSSIRRIATHEEGFGSTSLVSAGNGTESVDIANYNGEWALQSAFGRINYNYNNKYLIEFNVRRDGSSRFGENNRWATFPGLSAGYVVSKENFWNVGFISHLKMRASWGKLGVQSSNLYPFASEVLLGSDYNGYSGASLNKLGNPNLAWETTTTKDLGVELGLFDGRVFLEAGYFHKLSTDILTDLDNPLTTGISSEISVNSAKIENKGWELALNTKHNIGKLKIASNFNITHVNNKVLQIDPSLTNKNDKVQVESSDNVWWIRGESVNTMYGHEFGGIFQVEDFNSDGSLVSGVDYSWIGYDPRPGDIKYVDQNGDMEINEDDMTVIGNRVPEWVFGFNFDFEYRAWDLGLFFQGVSNVQGFINRYTGNYGHSGLREYWLDGWTEENRSNEIPRIFVDRDGFNGRTIEGNGGLAMNEFWVKDLSYLRLKNIVLGYTLPANIIERLPINGLRVYASGQNLLTFDKLDDLDPERSPFANHFGGVLPQSKAYTFGLNLTF